MQLISVNIYLFIYYIYNNMHSYDTFQHVHVITLHVNIITLHVNMNKLHDNISILHDEIWYMLFILQVGQICHHNTSHSELYCQMLNLQTLAFCHYICDISHSHEVKTYVIFTYL